MKLEFTVKRFKYFLILFFLILSTASPNVVFDPDIEFNVMRKYHTWLTPYTYQLIYANARYNNLTTSKVCGIIKEESNGDPNAVSHAGAVGLMQIMPCHLYLNGLQGWSLTDESINIYLGCKYYRWCLDYARGNEREAIRFYNAGPASVRNNYRNWRYIDSIIKHGVATNSMQLKNVITIR